MFYRFVSECISRQKTALETAKQAKVTEASAASPPLLDQLVANMVP